MCSLRFVVVSGKILNPILLSHLGWKWGNLQINILGKLRLCVVSL